MDAVFLARIQFGLTIGFHFLFPPLTIGLAWLIVWIKGAQLRTGSDVYRQMAKFWTKLFAISFAVGVATGIVMEFQFGTNWAEYSRMVGDIFGAPLAAEGIFAFFLESTFLGVLIFGEKRFSPKVTFFAALMVAVGATMSAFWIIVANSWQQTPAGFEIVAGRAQLTDFWAAVFNPSTLPRYFHTVNAALMTGSFFMIGVAAWLLLKGKHLAVGRASIKIALVVGLVTSLGQWGLGHWHAVQVANTQPAKMAAFEGLFETTDRAGLSIVGIPDEEARVTHFDLRVPLLLSWMIGASSDTVIQGLNDFPRDEWPPVLVTFASYHTMIGVGTLMLALVALGILLWFLGRLERARWYLWATLPAILLPFIGNEVGWMAAEIGRQPWVVHGILKTADAASPSVSAGEILASIIMFSLIYLLLGALWIFLLVKKIKKGPDPVAGASDSADESSPAAEPEATEVTA